MKIYSFLICFILMVSCAHVSDTSTQTSSQADIDGWWTGRNQLFNFKSDEDDLKGTVYLGQRSAARIYGGKIKGDRITFWIKVKGLGANKVKYDYKGNVYDDEIVFNFTITTPINTSSYPRLIVKRIGAGNETYDDIKKILKNKF